MEKQSFGITYTTTDFTKGERLLKFGAAPLNRYVLQEIAFDGDGVTVTMRSGQTFRFMNGQYTASQSLLGLVASTDHDISITSSVEPHDSVRICGYNGELPEEIWEDIKARLNMIPVLASVTHKEESVQEGSKQPETSEEEISIGGRIVGEILGAFILALFLALITNGEVGYWGRTGIIFAILLLLIVYFIPSIIAFHIKHQYRWIIFVVNLLFGATLIGWVISFIVCFFFKEPKKSLGSFEITVRKDCAGMQTKL